MSGIFRSRVISFVSRNYRLANPMKKPNISSASPVITPAIFRSRLMSSISEKYQLANPAKEPITSSESPVDGQPSPRSRVTIVPPPITADSNSFDKFHSRWGDAFDFPEFVYDEKDLASEESLWALYERWMFHFKVFRDPEDKKRRFRRFMKKAKNIHELNNSQNMARYRLVWFADNFPYESPRLRRLLVVGKVSLACLLMPCLHKVGEVMIRIQEA